MAIKKLQNNFTTPEQSKQLLELGVPADSADMHYHQECVRIKYGKEEFEYFLRYGKPDTNKYSTNIPCWSVGRLIEIYELCSGKIYERKSARLVKEGNVAVMKEITIIEDIIGDIVNARLYIYPHMDFSKLEE